VLDPHVCIAAAGSHEGRRQSSKSGTVDGPVAGSRRACYNGCGRGV